MNLLIYFLFFSVPFVNTTIANNFLLIDIPSALLLMSILPFFRRALKGGVHFIDYLVLIYTLWGIFSVLVGSAQLYESMRDFRWLVLLPVCVYFVIRFAFVKFEIIIKGFFFLIPGTFYHGLPIIVDFFKSGMRPTHIEGAISLITSSLLFSICFGLIFFLTKKNRSNWKKAVKFISLFYFALALFATFSRTSFLASILAIGLVPLISGKSLRMKVLTNIILMVMIIFITMVIFNFQLPTKHQLSYADIHELQNSSLRLSNIDLYIYDINKRMYFWSYSIGSIKNFFWGNGFAARNIGYTEQIGFALGSPHNFLISALLTGGYPFLILTILIVHSTLKTFQKIKSEVHKYKSIDKFLLYSFCVTFLVTLTNDFSGRRVIIFFLLIAVIVRYSIFSKGNPITNNGPLK